MSNGVYLNKRKARVLLIALYTDQYPSLGESHGISVLAGCLEDKFGSRLEAFRVVDMIALDVDRHTNLLDIVHDFRPTIVGISVPYGGYDYLKIIYPTIKKILQNWDHLVIFGGPIPTYIPVMVLQEIDRSAIVIQGEGDEAITKIVYRWLNKDSFQGVANICYLDKNTIRCQERALVDTSKVPPPYRKHIIYLISRGAQIYVESSRGCSWAACTFCSRGLTDVEGNCGEYRRFPFQRLAKDLLTLRDYGAYAVTFADEDFLGGPFHECEQFVLDLEAVIIKENIHICFDVSMTVCSVYSSKWAETELKKRKIILTKLKNIGLRKVFLGIESGSPTQLARYCKKEQNQYDCAMAVKILQNLGINIEVGFIMFDPLCNLQEIEDNIHFLQKNDLIGFISELAQELRLQPNSRYLEILERAEQKIGTTLFERTLDPNTLTYPPKYVDPDVEIVVSIVRFWNLRMRPLYYPLKNLSRYGKGGILGDLTMPVRELLVGMRHMYAHRLLQVVNEVKSSGSVSDVIKKGFDYDLQKFSQQILRLFGCAPKVLNENPTISSLLTTAHEERSRYL